MIIMTDVKERYGVEPMTFEEEMTLWKEHPNLAQTRNSKIMLCETFEKIRGLAEQMNRYSKTIPEEDNDYHAKLVKNLADKMDALWHEMDETIYNAIYNP